MKKKLFAHLGAHKTATSLVQRYFMSKSKHYEREGVKFLTREQVSSYISWGDKIIQDGEKFSNFLHQESENTKAPNLMFSNENSLGRPLKNKAGLYPNHRPILKSLKDITKDFDTKIVFSIRRQADFLQSYYLQRIHQGDFLTFSQFIDEIDLGNISWRPLIECLHETFGKDNVIILDFDYIKMGQNEYLKHFLNVTVGPEIKFNEEFDKIVNPSISDRGLHMALRINPLLRKNTGETGLVRKFLQAHFSNQTETRPLLLSEELKSKIGTIYDREYEDLISG